MGVLNAAPRLGPRYAGRGKTLTTIEARPPDPLNWPKGCRSRRAVRFASKSATSIRKLLPVGEDGASRCWSRQMGQNLPQRGATACSASGET